MSGPPPPPPPHGEAPRSKSAASSSSSSTSNPSSSGLPPGKYDIFVIPQHSAGSGFLYLPSLQPNVNSFAAGFVSALLLVVAAQSLAPALRAWWVGFSGLGSLGMTFLLAGVAFSAWTLGRTQSHGAAPPPPPPHSTSRQGPDPSRDHGGARRGPDGSAGQGAGHGAPRDTNTGPPPPPHAYPPGSAPPPRQDKPPSSSRRQQQHQHQQQEHQQQQQQQQNHTPSQQENTPRPPRRRRGDRSPSRQQSSPPSQEESCPPPSDPEKPRECFHPNSKTAPGARPFSPPPTPPPQPSQQPPPPTEKRLKKPSKKAHPHHHPPPPPSVEALDSDNLRRQATANLPREARQQPPTHETEKKRGTRPVHEPVEESIIKPRAPPVEQDKKATNEQERCAFAEPARGKRQQPGEQFPCEPITSSTPFPAPQPAPRPAKHPFVPPHGPRSSPEPPRPADIGLGSNPSAGLDEALHPDPDTAEAELDDMGGTWERAREEMKKKEGDRKQREADSKRREEAAKKLAELRAKDAKDRAEREKERQRKEAEQKAKEESERLEEERRRREKDLERLRLREKEAKEREEYRKREAAAEAKAKAALEAKAAAEAGAAAEARAAAEAQAAADAKAAAEERERAATEMEFKGRAEARARARAESEAKAEAEARIRARARAEAEAEARARAEAEAKAKAEAEAEARARARAEEQMRAEAEVRARAEARAKARREAQAMAEAQAEEEARAAAPEIRTSRLSSGYAFSGVGEKTQMWPNGRPTVPPSPATPTAAPPTAGPTASPPSSTLSSKTSDFSRISDSRTSRSQSPTKRRNHNSRQQSDCSSARRPPPSARTYGSSNLDDAYSYRPYDQAPPTYEGPPRPRHSKSGSSLAGSDASWAASQTTGQTTPPSSMRGAYFTRDPDKIVLHGVYMYMTDTSQTPASQLISGVGTVTDGLILRITTEGLFVDDDVRGVPQRDWDVKAWTLKSAEVWCPPHCLSWAASAASASAKSSSSSSSLSSSSFLHRMAAGSRTRNAERGGARSMMGDDADLYLTEMLRQCRDCCRLGLCERTWRCKGLHLLRATVRDQESKRYLFVIEEPEGWKLAVALQRLRRGSQVRDLAVGSLAPSEARGLLETLGWTTLEG